MRELARLEINGGRVSDATGAKRNWRLALPVVTAGYANAQIDDYAGLPRRRYPWQPGVTLRLRARFSHPAGCLRGTAGFGFWNTPFSDPTISFPWLPQATWFFFGSPPNDLPLAPTGPGRGWFAATLDATTPRALLTAPLAPAVVALNQFGALRRRIWPWVRRQLGIAYAQLPVEMTTWRQYELDWRRDVCTFCIDGRVVLATPHSPRGPLGFVAWIDNQYLVARPDGRFAWGTLIVGQEQWLEIEELAIEET